METVLKAAMISACLKKRSVQLPVSWFQRSFPASPADYVDFGAGASLSHAVDGFADVGAEGSWVIGIRGQSEHVTSSDFLPVFEPPKQRCGHTYHLAFKGHGPLFREKSAQFFHELWGLVRFRN